MQLKRKHRYLLSVLTGVLLSAAFPYIGNVPILAFIGLVPLLILEEHIFSKKLRRGKLTLHVYLAFVIYNALTCWWVYFASPAGVFMAIFANAALMILPWSLFHLTKKHVGVKEGYIGLPFFWLAFEYFHFHWELSWPWLTFGNVFSIIPDWVQWYEFTGVLGGSLWILIVNLLIFQVVKNVWGRKQALQKQRGIVAIMGFVLFVPIIISYTLLNTREYTGREMEVVVVQPNIDPYNEKFSTSPRKQLDKIIGLAKTKVTTTTDFIVAPETAIPTSVFEKGMEKHPAIKLLHEILDTTLNGAWVIGASTHNTFENVNSPASKPIESGGYFENYNTALLLKKDTTDVFLYHKSKLVLGVEFLPFPWIFQYVEEIFDLGGTSGTLGVAEEPVVFEKNNFRIIPSICYESIYGGYLASFSQIGTIDALFVITNDGWWKDTPGYKQHFSFSRLRAIEMRKPVVRSANTGKSGIIDPYGNIIHQTKWWVPDVFNAKVQTNNTVTFYMQYGDIIGRTSGFVAALILLLVIVKRLRKLGVRTPYGGREES